MFSHRTDELDTSVFLFSSPRFQSPHADEESSYPSIRCSVICFFFALLVYFFPLFVLFIQIEQTDQN